jgi:hypothetical protein
MLKRVVHIITTGLLTPSRSFLRLTAVLHVAPSLGIAWVRSVQGD